MKDSLLLDRRVRKIPMRRMSGPSGADETDFLAAEEPLEIRVEGHSIAIVMRTPGEDQELAAGFLVTEGLLHAVDDLVDIKHQTHCLVQVRNGSDRPVDVVDTAPAPAASPPQPGIGRSAGNVINVQLKHPESMDLKKLTRHVFTSSSCGICSKASIEAVRQQFPAAC